MTNHIIINVPEGLNLDELKSRIDEGLKGALQAHQDQLTEQRLRRAGLENPVGPGKVMVQPAYTEAPDDVIVSHALARLRRLRPRMFELLETMAEVQTRKAGEYATAEDPYSNYREAGDAGGQPGWKYAEMRLAEKQARHKELVRKDLIDSADGGYVESAVDRANMALISLVMYEQDQETKRPRSNTT